MQPSIFSEQTCRPFFSIIVPVYNGGDMLVACLKAIQQSWFQSWELIVVDDGSTDQSAAIAQSFGAKVLHTAKRSGPAAARNLGAQVAQGSYLCFIDADCEVHADALTHFAKALKRHPEVDAAFGSYDDAPKALNFVAQFKNLMHHYVHQTGQEEASTFWSGCGVIRRTSFLQLGGFDIERYPRPCIEDIDLGYRLQQKGGKIRLVKQAQAKHHKAWTFWHLIKTDVCDRGIPWTRLLLSYQKGFINDLNLQVSHRISVVAVYLLVLCGLFSCYQASFAFLALGLASLLLVLNIDVYAFFFNQRGWRFTLGSILMHWLYYFYSGVAFFCGTAFHWFASSPRFISPIRVFPVR
ncbi:MAG: glycosyltransferase [Scytolyngbya sp. HA4215-MV1]|nr:glycosyltransferase [Scytolyngbya sp. HA4215-MV1]